MSQSRLLLDLSAAFNQGAGIGRYARGVVGAAAPQLSEDFEVSGWYAPDDAGDTFHGLARSSLGTLAENAQRCRLGRRRIDQLWFRLPLSLTSRAIVPGAEVIYSPDFTAPPVAAASQVVTVHDLAFLKTPEYCPPALRNYLTSVVPRQIAGARRVVAVSEATRRDLVEQYGVPTQLIAVIPNAADERFFVATPLSSTVRRRLRIPERYALTVGTLEPRKNYPTLFEVADRVQAETGVPLVVVGRDGWSNVEIRRDLLELAERGIVIDLTNLDDEYLPGLYSGAAVTIQIPWYEGFGIPVVEALAAGAPVVASDIPAHREVAGDVATLRGPDDVEGLTTVVLETLEADRDKGVERRRAAARAFSWSRSGTMLAALLREVRDDR